MNTATRDTLLRAAEIIEKGGACKGVLENGRGEHCTLGAIYATTGGAHCYAELALHHVIHRGVALWNDSRPDASITPEVAAMLRYVAEPERWECPEVSP
jgi:hypothetical protein